MACVCVQSNVTLRLLHFFVAVKKAAAMKHVCCDVTRFAMKWFGKSYARILGGQSSSKQIFRYREFRLAPIHIHVVFWCVVIYFGIADRAQNGNPTVYWRSNWVLCVLPNCVHLMRCVRDMEYTQRVCVLQFVAVNFTFLFPQCLPLPFLRRRLLLL